MADLESKSTQEINDEYFTLRRRLDHMAYILWLRSRNTNDALPTWRETLRYPRGAVTIHDCTWIRSTNSIDATTFLERETAESSEESEPENE